MKKLLIIIAIIGLVGMGTLAYAFLKPPEEASGPIEAIPLDTNTAEIAAVESDSEPTPQPPTATPTPEPVEEATLTTETDANESAMTETNSGVGEESMALETEADPDPTSTPEPEPEMTEEVSEAAVSPLIFEIVPAKTEARFYINEVLRGDPITVVGATDQVAGQFALNPADLSTAEVGIVQVNARTLATDNNFRNRAIKNRILLTDDHEFITFTPTGVVGLPETAAVGQTFTFQIEGGLSITDVTRPTTFEVTATAISDMQIEATATTSFLYTDFELFIPDAPAVDTVDDEVRLEVDFVAEAVDG